MISNTTNIIAKEIDMIKGCEYCVEYYFLPLIMESNTLYLIKIVEREWECSWRPIRKIKYFDRRRSHSNITNI